MNYAANVTQQQVQVDTFEEYFKTSMLEDELLKPSLSFRFRDLSFWFLNDKSLGFSAKQQNRLCSFKEASSSPLHKRIIYMFNVQVRIRVLTVKADFHM